MAIPSKGRLAPRNTVYTRSCLKIVSTSSQTTYRQTIAKQCTDYRQRTCTTLTTTSTYAVIYLHTYAIQTSIAKRRLLGRLTSPLSTRIGYIRDKLLGRDLVPRLMTANDTVPPDLVAFLFSNDPKWEKRGGGSFTSLL